MKKLVSLGVVSLFIGTPASDGLVSAAWRISVADSVWMLGNPEITDPSGGRFRVLRDSGPMSSALAISPVFSRLLLHGDSGRACRPGFK